MLLTTLLYTDCTTCTYYLYIAIILYIIYTLFFLYLIVAQRPEQNVSRPTGDTAVIVERSEVRLLSDKEKQPTNRQWIQILLGEECPARACFLWSG